MKKSKKTLDKKPDVEIYYSQMEETGSSKTPERKTTMKTIKELKKGEYFTLRQINEPTKNQVWVKGEWEPSSRRYTAFHWSDINNGRLFKGDKQVYTDFTF